MDKINELGGDFVVLLNKDGVIIHSNLNWRNYCKKKQIPSGLWMIGSNYLDCMVKMKKFTEVQCINEVLNEIGKEKMNFSVFFNKETTDCLSIKYQHVSLENNSAGVSLHKHLLTHESAISCLNAEVVLESMTGAFVLLDNQMRFYFLNAEVEKILQRKKEELIGCNIWSCYPKAVGSKFHANVVRAVKDGVTLEFEEYYASLDRWYSVKVSPVTDCGIAVYSRVIEKDKERESSPPHIPCYDYLTGWSTRVKLVENLKQTLQDKSSFSILYINLDDFKYINKLYSHQIGDEVIKSIARSIEKLLQPADFTARLDGDELIILRMNQQDEQIIKFLKQVIEIFNQPVVLERFRSINVKASIGVSSYPEHANQPEELIAFAEIAMRTAKKQIGSCYAFFDPHMEIDLNRRLLIEKSLAGNIEDMGLYFLLQPQVDCVTGHLTGVEVLSRWHHPVFGFISPIEFINIAEETGTILKLTNYLIKEVFCFIKKTEEHFERFPKIAINITSSLVSSKEFFDGLFEMMQEYRISPDQIELEITESVKLMNSEITLTNLIECQSKGISIALDDFGTGFSMLAYLIDYPIDKIKLDKSFIDKIGYSVRSEGILKSLIQFVRSIDCDLLAEGVETLEESMFLQANGCTIHQGYLYDKPLKPEFFNEKYLGITPGNKY